MSKTGFYALLIIGTLLMPAALVFHHMNSRSLAEIAVDAGDRLSARSDEGNAALDLYFSGDSPELFSARYRLYRQERIGLYLYVKDSLRQWNNSREAAVVQPLLFTKATGIRKLKGGLYLYNRKISGDSTAVALSLLKPEYELQNRYLHNDFEKWTGIPAGIRPDSMDGKGAIVSLKGVPAFAIRGAESSYQAPGTADISYIMFMGGFICLLVALLYYMAAQPVPWKVWLIIIAVALSRPLMAWLGFPPFFYESLLYDVRLYGNAQSFLNGFLGDILLNSMVLLFTAAALYFRLKPSPEKPADAWKLLLLAVLVFLAAHQFNRSVISLVTNSTMSFDFLNIFNIGLPSFIALLALGLNAIAIFIALKRMVTFFTDAAPAHSPFFFGLLAAVCAGLYAIDAGYGWFEALWPLVFAASLYLAGSIRRVRTSLIIGLHIVIMSAVTARILNDHIERNEKKDLEVLSLKLGERQDPVLESEFSAIPARIAADESLKNLMMILPSTGEAIQELLNQKYFNDYFRRYLVEFSLFDKSCNPLLTIKNPLLLNQGFFDDQIRYQSDSTFVPGLYFNKNYRKNSRYIGRIALGEYRLYVMMQPKQFEELGTLPDLLLDESQQKQEKLKNFSYAVYRSGQNTSSYGNFNYPLFLPDPVQLAQSSPDHSHVYNSPDENTDVIISRSLKTWNYFFTFNSYILLFYSVVTYFCFLLYGLLFTGQFRQASLTRRIQAIIIVLLLLAMSAVGITSGRLVTRQFRTENREQLKEKTEIIINELAQFKTEMLFDEGQKEAVNLKLNEYARLFNTDISLFDSAGFLFTTSQPRLYSLGLAATVANPRAMWQIKNNLSSAVSITERAGTLDYLSLYTPIFDTGRKLSGFINLPYFARQSDLVNELSGIISGLVNVYVILFVISILAGLILAGYITQPLRLIQQQIANISLGRKNEKIVWQSKDEIGRLIAEYNLMLVKLEESAQLLAQSERESAWREMARQVAHEIKNPLTPMKLNLQYLQHLLKSDPADFREKFEKASAGIIEQIDALANIANEFSNFAKLPVTQLQVINLAEVINSSVQIFVNQKNTVIRNRIAESSILVKGDREQCLRVFNNILSNAVEALDETPAPLIEIGRLISDEHVTIVIRDNGSGISEEMKPRIFTPNFTTKSTGSGLGLAMVKNIMEGFGGRIWFESEPGLGTVFYLEFKAEGSKLTS